jgi:hypothetical protein
MGTNSDFLLSKSQLIIKSFLNMERIDLFVKVLVFVSRFCLNVQGRKEGGQNLNP